MAGSRSLYVYCAFFMTFSWSSTEATAHSQFRHFTAKTPYLYLRPEPKYEVDDLYYLNDVSGMACNAIHASSVIRHGSRFPGLGDVEHISLIHERLVAAMEPDVVPSLYEWKNRFPSNNDKALNHMGEEEQEQLGKRFGKRLSTLFEDEDLSNFRFIVSSMLRTKQSASSFYEGFANVIHREDEIEDEFDSEVNDEMVRFFDLCAKYVYNVNDNKTAYKEFFDFMEGEQITDLKKKMYEKMAIKEDVLTGADVRLIHLVCGYELASFNESPWCSLFDPEDMAVMDYLGDLKHWIKNGYAYNITWQQSCPLISEIFFGMDETIVEIETAEDDEEEGGYIVGQFAFGHAETLGPLFAALGLFNDSLSLRADNYNEQEKRLWRTSSMLPFSANIMFILYECVPEEFAEDEEIEEADYFIKMLVNEEPHLIPGCDKLHCSYNTVREHYADMIDKCDFKKICKKSPPKDEL